ncbi:MAG: hypothetical protein PHU21_02250 [Elusimicrobia bacterium]|nr:hypothetical protein [Elusimicrobiota bacterium]
MRLTALLLLALLAGPPQARAQQMGPPQAPAPGMGPPPILAPKLLSPRQRFLMILSEPRMPEDGRLLTMELELSSMTSAARLKFVSELAELRPRSALLKIVLAGVLCADGQQERASRILDGPGFARRDTTLQILRAAAWDKCGLPQRGVALLADLVRNSAYPPEAVRALQALLNMARSGSEREVVAAMKRRWRGQVDSGSRDLKTHRLLAEAYSWDRSPALEPLCRSAIRLFPRERAFPDLLAERYLLLGDWAAAEALRLDQFRALQTLRFEDYFLLLDVYVQSGRFAEAAAKLREGLADARLDPGSRRILEGKLAVLEAMARSRLSEPQAPACDFSDENGDFEVDCGGQSLSYSPESGRFAGQDAAARAVPLACRLMEKVEEDRFSGERSPELPAIGPRARELLKAAGYLDF